MPIAKRKEYIKVVITSIGRKVMRGMPSLFLPIILFQNGCTSGHILHAKHCFRISSFMVELLQTFTEG